MIKKLRKFYDECVDKTLFIWLQDKIRSIDKTEIVLFYGDPKIVGFYKAGDKNLLEAEQCRRPTIVLNKSNSEFYDFIDEFFEDDEKRGFVHNGMCYSIDENKLALLILNI